jgi:predicted DNA-binding transcriptional regulator AlpA
MNAGTRQIILTVVNSDPTVTPEERGRVLEALSDKQRPAGPPRLIRRKEVAERLGLSIRAVDRLAEEGTLSKRVLPGRVRSTGFQSDEVDALIRGEGAA